MHLKHTHRHTQTSTQTHRHTLTHRPSHTHTDHHTHTHTQTYTHKHTNMFTNSDTNPPVVCWHTHSCGRRRVTAESFVLNDVPTRDTCLLWHWNGSIFRIHLVMCTLSLHVNMLCASHCFFLNTCKEFCTVRSISQRQKSVIVSFWVGACDPWASTNMSNIIWRTDIFFPAFLLRCPSLRCPCF